MLNCCIQSYFSQLNSCDLLDSISSFKVKTSINFHGLFEKFFAPDDLMAIHQLDSIDKILKEAGLRSVKKGYTEIDDLPYEIYTLKFGNKCKRDAFLIQFDQHLLNYQAYWVLELFLKPGILAYENRSRKITVLRSNTPDQLLELQKCLTLKTKRFIDESIYR